MEGRILNAPQDPCPVCTHTQKPLHYKYDEFDSCDKATLDGTVDLEKEIVFSKHRSPLSLDLEVRDWEGQRFEIAEIFSHWS